LKTVLVTGGALRLGALLCQTFSQAGWRVWCHYQRSADAAQALQEQLQAKAPRYAWCKPIWGRSPSVRG